jgi:hypothetical protein
VSLIDVDDLFVRAASQLMAEMGIGFETYSKEEMDQLTRAVCSESAAIWDEFMLWVACGDDKREKTRMLLKANRVKRNLKIGY